MKKTLKKITATVLLATPLLVASAQTTFTEAQVAEKTSFQNQSRNGVTIHTLNSSIKNNTLHVQAQVQYSGSKNLHLYYRLIWLNAEGAQVAASGWKPVLLMPNKPQTISDTAPNTNAADFRLELNAE